MKEKKCLKEFLITFKLLIPVLIAFVFSGCLSSSLTRRGGEDFEKLNLYGGRIAIDASNPDKIKMFAGTYKSNGLYMTTDGGESWRAVETGGEIRKEDEFSNHTVWAAKMAPNNPEFIWVAHNFWVEKSTNGGATWTHIKNSTMQQSEFRYCMSLAIAPIYPSKKDPNRQIVYVGTGGPNNTYSSGAIYKTVDGGAEWRKIKDFDFPVVDIAIDPQNKDIIWAVTSSFGHGGWHGTLYRSGDGGDTWRKIYSLKDSGYLAIAVKPDDSNTVFTGSGFGIIKHYFDGNKWKSLWPIIPKDRNDQDKKNKCRLVADLSFDPQDPDTLYATWQTPVKWGGDGIGKVARSTDGGDTWKIYPHKYNFKSLTIHPIYSKIIFAGEYNEGIFKSEDYGQTWTPINNGITTVTYDIAIDPNDSNHILAGTFAGLFEKRCKEPRSQLLRDTTYSVLFHPKNSEIFYAGLEGSLAKTSDGGQSWTYSNTPGSDYVSDIAIAIDHDPDKDTETIFIASGRMIYRRIDRRTDKGTDEGKFEGVLEARKLSGEYYPFNVVAIDPSDNQHIFAGGGGFFAPKVLGDLWESIDGGDNWTRTGLRNKIVNALLIDPEDPDIIYAGVGYSGGTDVPLYKRMRTEKGLEWIPSNEGIPGGSTRNWNSVTDLEFHPQNTNIIYAGTLSQGIYISNQARNWLYLWTPKYDVHTISISSFYMATQEGPLQLTRTGVTAGKVTDVYSQEGIKAQQSLQTLEVSP
ncbi:MAG: WD40/YVTN/BNR-like repeat-containing protein [Nitrospinota bacterium]